MESHKVYIAVSGSNPGAYNVSSTWAVRLDSPDGSLLSSNAQTDAVFVGVHSHDAYFEALREAVHHVPAGVGLEIIEQKEKSPLWWPFKPGPDGQPKAHHHRKDNGKELHKPTDLIKAIDSLAIARDIVLTCRPPATEDEREKWAQARDDVRTRREAAVERAAVADDKFL